MIILYHGCGSLPVSKVISESFYWICCRLITRQELSGSLYTGYFDGKDISQIPGEYQNLPISKEKYLMDMYGLNIKNGNWINQATGQKSKDTAIGDD